MYALQDILENESINLDWMFRYSLINDIVKVREWEGVKPQRHFQLQKKTKKKQTKRRFVSLRETQKPPRLLPWFRLCKREYRQYELAQPTQHPVNIAITQPGEQKHPFERHVFSFIESNHGFTEKKSFSNLENSAPQRLIWYRGVQSQSWEQIDSVRRGGNMGKSSQSESSFQHWFAN